VIGRHIATPLAKEVQYMTRIQETLLTSANPIGIYL
jgi:hypothetical protein